MKIGRPLHTLKPYSLHLIPLNYLKPYTIYLTALNVLFCVCLAHAGQRGVGNSAATGVALSTDSIKPLQIGNTIPEALWHMPLQMVKAGQEGSTTVKLNDYKGKLIILDFWATWCTACIAAMPKVDSVRERFKEEMVVLPVTYEREDKLLPFLQSNRIVNELKLTTVYGDSILSTYFAHKLIPHYVWIYKNNFYTATRANDISETNIRQLLSSDEIHAQQKVDILDFNAQIPLLCNVANKEFAVKGFNNVSFCNEIDGLGSKEGVSKLNNLTRRYFINRPLKELYRRALNSPHERLVFELPGQPFTGESLFCYEQVTAGDVVAQNEAMLVDLNNRLGLCQRKKRLYNSMLRKTEPVIIISAKPKRN
ncbi:TlpA family protein disulfide reductase [Olivibacter sp. SA151]